MTFFNDPVAADFHAVLLRVQRLTLPPEAQRLVADGMPLGYVLNLYPQTPPMVQENLLHQVSVSGESEDVFRFLKQVRNLWGINMLSATWIRGWSTPVVPALPMTRVHEILGTPMIEQNLNESYENLAAAAHFFAALLAPGSYIVTEMEMKAALRADAYWASVTAFAAQLRQTVMTNV